MGKNAAATVSLTKGGHIDIRPVFKTDNAAEAAHGKWIPFSAKFPVRAVRPAGEWYEVIAVGLPVPPFFCLSPAQREVVLSRELKDFPGIETISVDSVEVTEENMCGHCEGNRDLCDCHSRCSVCNDKYEDCRCYECRGCGGRHRQGAECDSHW